MSVLGLRPDGRPAVEPLPLTELGAWLRRQGAPADVELHGPDSFGPGVDLYGEPGRLDEMGWAVVWGASCPDPVRRALQPLVDSRRAEVGSLFREWTWDGSDLRTWMRTIPRTDPGFLDIERLPYYVLLVGPPTDLPFAFQVGLEQQYAVGRLGFEYSDPGSYAAYADSVLEYERSGPDPLTRRQIHYWAPRTDAATAEAESRLVGGLSTGLPGVHHLSRPVHERAPGWSASLARGERATRDALLETFAEDVPPALVLTASHGLAPRADHARQRALAGALVAHNYPGQGPVLDAHLVTGADVRGQPHGIIAVHCSCFGAGVPDLDGAPMPHVPAEALARAPFLSALPQALLSRRGGAALAVVGQVERAWGFATGQPSPGAALEPVYTLLQELMRGERVGHAFGALNGRHAALASALARQLQPNPPFLVSALELATTWAEYTDARSAVLLGDPAVRLLPHRLV